MRILFTCLLLGLALPASAQIYSYTDAKGNKVFTNQPPEGIEAKAVELPATNTVTMPAPAAAASSNPSTSTSLYSTLEVVDLPSEEALRANNGTFGVTVNVAPPLKPGHLLQLLLNGQPYGQPSPAQRLQLTNIDRGEHSLVVKVLSGGKAIQQSEAVNFTVQRVNTSSPALRPPPKPTPRPAP